MNITLSYRPAISLRRLFGALLLPMALLLIPPATPACTTAGAAGW